MVQADIFQENNQCFPPGTYNLDLENLSLERCTFYEQLYWRLKNRDGITFLGH